MKMSGIYISGLSRSPWELALFTGQSRISGNPFLIHLGLGATSLLDSYTGLKRETYELKQVKPKQDV